MLQLEAGYAADGGPQVERSIEFVAVVIDGGTLARYQARNSLVSSNLNGRGTYLPEPYAEENRKG